MKNPTRWQCYSGERFDWVTSKALQLADNARKNGRVEPAVGWADADWQEAEERWARGDAV
mgnify:CR=1 FL=1